MKSDPNMANDPIDTTGVTWQEQHRYPCGCWGVPEGQHIPGCEHNTSKYPVLAQAGEGSTEGAPPATPSNETIKEHTHG